MSGIGVQPGETAALRTEIETALLELALRGYTVRRARELMADQNFDLSPYPDALLINIMRQVDPALRAELDEHTTAEWGLARKMERVRRLCEAAENIEVLAETSAKWSAEYRRFLAQIQAELEPLGLEVAAHDSWAKLLQQLVALGGARVDGGTASAGGTRS